MKKQKKERSKLCLKLNLLTAFLALLVFCLSALSTVDLFLASISNAEEAEEYKVMVENLERLNTTYVWPDEKIYETSNVNITTESDGTYGRQGILDAIQAIENEKQRAINFEDGISQYGYVFETFGNFTVYVNYKGLEVNITESTYQTYEGYSDKSSYSSNAIAQNTDTLFGLYIVDRVYRDESDKVLKQCVNKGKFTKYDKETKRITADFSEAPLYSGGGETNGLLDITTDLNAIILDQCSLSRDLNTYKLELCYNYLGNEGRRKFLQYQDGMRDNSVKINKCFATIYFNTKGRIGYMAKATNVTACYEDIPVIGAQELTATLYEVSTFNYLTKNYVKKDFWKHM